MGTYKNIADSGPSSPSKVMMKTGDQIINLISDTIIANENLPAINIAEFDEISKPAHYAAGREYEPRKVIEDWGLGFYLGNVVKYISRAGRKGDPITDLKKARQYLDWEIEHLEHKKENDIYENKGMDE